jgi:simple sugar transport system permease protein
MVNVSIELTPRQETSRWLSVGIQALTVLLALCVASVALLTVDMSPVAIYSTMFLSSFTDPLQAARVLNRSAPPDSPCTSRYEAGCTTSAHRGNSSSADS